MVTHSRHSIISPKHVAPTDNCPVRTALHRNSLRGLTRVSCELREGMAVLHGKVSSFYLKQLAQEIVKEVEGVKLVVNRVDVSCC